ncbi:MAG TPA: SPOR domain-containing protein [Saprospiraceae bacterium]|nr:SPOR domain-containing protein [Saprospiraceae bacterium]
MRNNNLLTYVLYGLLGTFIIAAGYYAYQKQKEKKELAAREAAELEETLRDMGYASEETDSGSSHTGGDTIPVSNSKPATPAQKPAPSTSAPTSATQYSGKDLKPVSAPAPSTAAKSAPATTVAPKTAPANKPEAAVKGPGSGRWAVRAGTFSVMDGARKRLEQVIKAGYPNAEISKTKDGKAAVVVYRSNDRVAAIRVADDLEDKGIDAAVFDRQN